MGKGDHRSKKGKIWRGSHGKTRPTKLEGRKGSDKKKSEEKAAS